MTDTTSNADSAAPADDTPPSYAKAERVVAACRWLGLTLASAESCTGGLVAGAITAVPGSSFALERGYVTYSNQAKIDLLDVPESLLQTEGAVSAPVALAMARGARERAGVDIAVSVTGVAGPGGSDRKPEGLVHFACATAQNEIHRKAEFGAAGRERVRRLSVDFALDLICEALEGYEREPSP